MPETRKIAEIGISYCGKADMADNFKEKLAVLRCSYIRIRNWRRSSQTHTGEDAFAVMVRYAEEKILTGLSFFLVSLLLSFCIFSLLFQNQILKLTKKDFLTKKVIPLNYVACYPTEGVGDTTSQGGLCPLYCYQNHSIIDTLTK